MHGVTKGGLTPSLAPSVIDCGRVQGYPSIYSNRTVDVLEATDGWSWSLARRGSGYV